MFLFHRIPFVLVLFLLGVSMPNGRSATEARWPQFRGPNASGVSDQARPPIHFGPGSNVLWKSEVPSGASSPCIWDDRIFLTGYAEGKLDTRCVRRGDGRLLWRRPAPALEIEAYHRAEGSPAASTPATDGERVYVYFGSCGLICYDFEGEERWRVPMPVAQTIGDYGSGASLVVADGLVLVNRDQRVGSYLLALYGRTGQTAWRAERPEFISSYSTPVLWRWPQEGKSQVVLAGFLQLKAYDLQTGVEAWSVGGLPVAVCTTPVLGEGRLYFAGWSPGRAELRLPEYEVLLKAFDQDKNGSIAMVEAQDELLSLFKSYDRDGDGAITRAEWEEVLQTLGRGKNRLIAVRAGGVGDVTETHVVWEQTRGLPYVPSPLYYRGRIYLVKDGGMVSCYMADTGEVRYQQERLGALGNYYASPVAADGRIYVASADGTLTVFAAGDQLQILAQTKFGDRVLATPAIVDDTLYVRTASHLYAFVENHR